MVDGFSGGITRYQIGRPGAALLEPGVVAADGPAEPPIEMAAFLNLTRLRVRPGATRLDHKGRSAQEAFERMA
jgi:hypothetical protein